MSKDTAKPDSKPDAKAEAAKADTARAADAGKPAAKQPPFGVVVHKPDDNTPPDPTAQAATPPTK